MPTIIGLLCLSFVTFIVAWSLSLNQSFSIAAFERVFYYDDIITGNVDTSKYISNNFTNFEELPIDLWATSYQSDGENLNVTLWLNDIIVPENHTDYVSNGLYYQLDIVAVDPVNGTSLFKIYTITVSPEEDGTWTKTILEWSPPTLDGTQFFAPVKHYYNYYNYSDLFLRGANYIRIPISLDEIGDPESFNLHFYALAMDDTLYDSMPYTLAVPPEQNEINLEPLSLTARPGESSSFDISVHGIELSARSNVSLQDANEEDGIRLDFAPDILEFDLNGTRATKLEVSILRDTQFAGQIVPVDVIVNQTTIDGTSLNFSKTFGIEVLPPRSIREQTIAFFSNFYLLWVPVIAAVFGLWFTRGVNQKVIEFTQISHTDILTVNASVIVGVLIFLTLSGSGLFTQIGILTATIVVPFASSIIVILRYGQVPQSIKLTILGFVYLVVTVILIGFETGA